MRLQEVSIKNFRSIGEEILEISFIAGHNILVGENNVGKSSIIESIKRILNYEVGWDIEDWHLGNNNKTIEISITVILDENQINEIISLFNFPITVEEFQENFTNKLIYKFEKKLNYSFLTFAFNDFYVEKDTGWFGQIDRLTGYSHIDWREFISEVSRQRNKITTERLKETFEKYRTLIGNNIRIVFPNNISQGLLNILRQNIFFIEEFRERPQKTLSEFLTSSTGRELASVLFNLKNSRQKVKFEQIQTYFQKLFPNLKLDVIRENNEIKILIQKFEVESTTFFIGSGILESILLLTHSIAHKGKILCIDHPELHLHPHTQRLLSSFLKGVKESQILLVTHSPYFVNLDSNNSLVRVIQSNMQTKVIKLPTEYFDNKEYSKLEQFLDIDSKELFFSRKVILVEGQRELGALPVFATEIYDFDENNVSIVNVGGKNNFELFVKLCEGFKIPYLIIADKDADMIVTKIKDSYSNLKSFIITPKFDDLLPQHLVEEAKKIIGESSKPRIGRYVAQKMVKSDTIPIEINQIIEIVKNLDI